MTSSGTPSPPQRDLPDSSWEHFTLYKSVREAIATLPVQILDKPSADSGGDFGRLARTGMMDSYMAKLNEVSLCGIKTIFWREFLKAFQESTTDAQARAALDRLRQRIQQATNLPSPIAQATFAIIAELERLLDLPI